jgi:acetamidase/formamidase
MKTNVAARVSRRMAACLLLLAPPSVPAEAQDKAPRVVRYQATIDNVKYVYGVAPPVARLAPGDILETNTLDCFGNAIRKPGDTLALVKGDNPLTGPFFIEGAQPGDTLVVKFLEVQLDSDQGLGAFAPGFGALSSTFYTPMLNPPIPERIYFYPVDRARKVATFRAQDSDFTTEIPLQPFVGCVGVAPPGGEARMSVTPGEWGGNMDAPEASPGHTLYLPVNVPGALLYLGDGHAVQGDGEVAGTGLEIAMKVRIQVDVVKGKAIRWPRFENDEYLMALGAYRPLDDALRIAFTELVGWMRTDYGISDLDAYELLSKVATIRLAEMVDPNYVIIGKIHKRFLPPKK